MLRRQASDLFLDQYRALEPTCGSCDHFRKPDENLFGKQDFGWCSRWDEFVLKDDSDVRRDCEDW